AAAGAIVRIASESFNWSAEVTLDGNGRAELSGVPTCRLSVETDQPYGVGGAEGLVASGDTLTIHLRVGSQSFFPINLTGTDGRPRWVNANVIVDEANDGSCLPFCGTQSVLNK